ncbi:MAG: hypothetical protein HY815_05805 [Candidatus Riflebacteria bacterium]|nr:hypothetical protein [Candidatus Riflebacteria bacterium]
MRLWCILLAIGFAMMSMGCGEEDKKTSIAKDKYEQIWGEITAAMMKKKGMIVPRDQEAILKKHGIAQADWKTAIDVYGVSEEIREKQRKAMEGDLSKKMTKPSARSGGPQ